jgi:arsenate reductase
MQKVIFACVHNAGRSQMAAAFFNQLADRTKAEAVSAGTEPGLRTPGSLDGHARDWDRSQLS